MYLCCNIHKLCASRHPRPELIWQAIQARGLGLGDSISYTGFHERATAGMQ